MARGAIHNCLRTCRRCLHGRVAYLPHHLLLIRRIYSSACKLDVATFRKLDEYGLLRYRGKRAGSGRDIHHGRRWSSSRRPTPNLRVVGNGATVNVIVGNRLKPREIGLTHLPRSLSLRYIHADRHSTPSDRQLICGSINVQSLSNKVDDLLEVRRTQHVDVLFITESWHDSDSVCIRRLRVDGFQVVDRPRPRLRADSLMTNHGGIVVAAVSGVRLMKLDLGVTPTTFELLCVRVAVGSSSFVAVIVYRPGSAVISAAFFVEMSDVLDRLATFAEPVLLTGDVNIHLERSTDSDTGRFVEMLTARGLARIITDPTHSLGGALDVVATRVDIMPSKVDVIDVGLSDHSLLRWTMPSARPCPVYTSRTGRSWSHLDVVAFHATLQSSLLSPRVLVHARCGCTRESV
jgi:hypothetical protein